MSNIKVIETGSMRRLKLIPFASEFNEIKFTPYETKTNTEIKKVDIATEFKKYLETSDISELIRYYKISDAEYEYIDMEKFRSLIMDKITSQWYDINAKHIKDMTYTMILNIVNRESYKHTKDIVKNNALMKRLEDTLAMFVIVYCDGNKKVNEKQFKELFSKLKHEVISINIFRQLISLHQCKLLRQSDHCFSEKLLETICNMNENAKTKKWNKRY